MKKISHRSQLKIRFAAHRGINYDQLIEKYGIRFFCQLVNYLTKDKNVKIQTRPAIYPAIKKFNWQDTEQIDQYFEDLEEAGFKIKTKPEDFVDEDTGQVVTLQRRYLGYLKR